MQARYKETEVVGKNLCPKSLSYSDWGLEINCILYDFIKETYIRCACGWSASSPSAFLRDWGNKAFIVRDAGISRLLKVTSVYSNELPSPLLIYTLPLYLLKHM